MQFSRVLRSHPKNNMPRKQNKAQDSPITREQLNAVIALLLVLIGDEGQRGLLKKRRANKKLVKYFGKQLGFNNKDLAGILNTTKSSISNLKTSKRRKKK